MAEQNTNLAEFPDWESERQEKLDQSWLLLNDVAGRLRAKELIDAFEYYELRDVHAYYSRGNNVVHIQAYPNMGAKYVLPLFIRLMDRSVRDRLRTLEISIGNEHPAVKGSKKEYVDGLSVDNLFLVTEEVLKG